MSGGCHISESQHQKALLWRVLFLKASLMTTPLSWLLHRHWLFSPSVAHSCTWPGVQSSLVMSCHLCSTTIPSSNIYWTLLLGWHCSVFWGYSWNHTFAFMGLIFQEWETSSKKTDHITDSNRGNAGKSNKEVHRGCRGWGWLSCLRSSHSAALRREHSIRDQEKYNYLE